MSYTLITLTFVEFKPEFIKKLGQLRVQEKDIATFVCEMSSENLTPIWMKGGQKLTANKKYDIITDKTVQKLIIHDVSFEDKAEYTCIIGETSTWAKLIVEGECIGKMKQFLVCCFIKARVSS